LNEHSEFLNYFSEYKEIFNDIENKYNLLKQRLEDDILVFKKLYQNKNRKDIALWANNYCINPSLIFCYLDKKIENVNEYLFNLSIDNILKLMEKIK
jgi:hypothetical protein